MLAFVKPPADAVRQHIIAAMKAAGKPVVALFLGFHLRAREENVWFCLDAGSQNNARLACLLSRVTSQRKEMVSTSGVIRSGCYTGGTLAAETAGLLAGYLGVAADTEHHHGMMLDADGHQIIDLGVR